MPKNIENTSKNVDKIHKDYSEKYLDEKIVDLEAAITKYRAKIMKLYKTKIDEVNSVANVKDENLNDSDFFSAISIHDNDTPNESDEKFEIKAKVIKSNENSKLLTVDKFESTIVKDIDLKTVIEELKAEIESDQELLQHLENQMKKQRK